MTATLFEEPPTATTPAVNELTVDWLRAVGYLPMCKGSKMLWHPKATMFAWCDGYIGAGNSTTGWVRTACKTREHLQRMVRDVYGIEIWSPDSGDRKPPADGFFEDEPE